MTVYKGKLTQVGFSKVKSLAPLGLVIKYGTQEINNKTL